MSAAAQTQDQDPWLSPEQVAARYQGNLSVRTLANWRTSGGGPEFCKIGGKVMYRLSAVTAWEAKRTVNNTSQYKRS